MKIVIGTLNILNKFADRVDAMGGLPDQGTSFGLPPFTSNSYTTTFCRPCEYNHTGNYHCYPLNTENVSFALSVLQLAKLCVENNTATQDDTDIASLIVKDAEPDQHV